VHTFNMLPSLVLALESPQTDFTSIWLQTIMHVCKVSNQFVFPTERFPTPGIFTFQFSGSNISKMYSEGYGAIYSITIFPGEIEQDLGVLGRLLLLMEKRESWRSPISVCGAGLASEIFDSAKLEVLPRS